MDFSKKITIVALSAMLISGFTFATVATATPATPPPTSTADSVTGTLTGSDRPLKATNDQVELKTKTPTSVTTFDLTYPEGSASGWHSHPGIVIAVVKSGSVVRQMGCTSQTFGVGDSFTEDEKHNVSNPGPGAAVLSITRVYPTSLSSTPRLDETEPRCRN